MAGLLVGYCRLSLVVFQWGDRMSRQTNNSNQIAQASAAAGAEPPERFDNLDTFFISYPENHNGKGIYDWLKTHGPIEKDSFGLSSQSQFRLRLRSHDFYDQLLDDDTLPDANPGVLRNKEVIIVIHFLDRAIVSLRQRGEDISTFLKISDCDYPDLRYVLDGMSYWINEWCGNGDHHRYFSQVQEEAFKLYQDAVRAQNKAQNKGFYTKAAKTRPAVTVAKSSLSTFGASAAAAAAASSDHSKGDSVKHDKEEAGGYESLPSCS
jgi:hypothetical protein